jgi:hypothetical protein
LTARRTETVAIRAAMATREDAERAAALPPSPPSLPAGNPQLGKVVIGSLISGDAVKSIEALVKEAASKGENQCRRPA